MKKILFLMLSFCALAMTQAHAADFYWVGGGGNWSDLNHWRLGSATGSTTSIVPSALDNVFFTENSGFGTTAASKTVILDRNGSCRSMSWLNVENKPIFNRTSDTYVITIAGDLSLSPDVTYNVQVVFTGATVNTITSNGIISGYLAIEVNKSGGQLNLMDSLVNKTTNRTNNLILTAGTLNVSGKKIDMVQFNSNNTNARTLNMNNSDLNFTYRWDLRGAGKILNADGSMLYTGAYLFTDGGNYDNVECNGKDYNNFAVDNTHFKKLVFTNPVATSYGQVDSGNQVDSLIFKGQGRIYDNNTIHYLMYNGNGMVQGKDNTVHFIKNMGDFQLTNGPLTVDSLLLAPNKSATFNGIVNINNYLEASGISCEAFTEITADTTKAQFNFGPAAEASINNVYLTGVRATGSITPITVTGIDGDGNQGFTINPPASSAPSTFYWVGGAGDWNDKSHWSLSSGGIGGACIPFMNDDVVFDNNSGLTTNNNIITTTGNVYCHNMTWENGITPAVFNESTTKNCLVYGSVSLSQEVTMNSTLQLVGSENTTVTFNGASLGKLGVTVQKLKTSTVQIMDDWENTAATLLFQEGNLIMSNRNIHIYIYQSTPTYLVRHLDITNTNIHVDYAFRQAGLYIDMIADGAVVTSDYICNVSGEYYPEMNLTYTGTNEVFTISNTNFGELNFTSNALTAAAAIGKNNIIRKLTFNGAGKITGTNNVIDSLLFGASRNYTISGVNTINKYMRATSASCTGLSEIKGDPTGTFAFDPAAKIYMSNIYLMNMSATGQTPTFTGADAGGNSGWVINSSAGGPRYWVGGSGDWNDATHWSLISGGPSGACIPTVFDDVYFDDASGFASGNNNVTINNGNAYCHNLDWSVVTTSPVLTKAAQWNMEVWGPSIQLNNEATLNVSPFTVKGANAATMTGAPKGNFDITVDKEGGSLSLGNDLTNTQTDIVLTKGDLDLSDRQLFISSFDNAASSNKMGVKTNNARIILSGLWRYSGDMAQHSLEANNTLLSASQVVMNGFSYDTVNVTGTKDTAAQLDNTQIAALTFTDANPASKIGISGNNNTLGSVVYKGGGGIYGTANTMDTLIFFPGSSYAINPGTTNTINNAWYGSGTPCRLTEIINTGASPATIVKTNGSASFDYIRVEGVAAVAETPFHSAAHTTDLGNNTGWDIEPYNGATPLQGLGEDRAIRKEQMPYTLNTEGFFGTPLAQFQWGDGSTGDSLVITDTGTYSVQVMFEDGCIVSDAIHISFEEPLPVELKVFNVGIADCQPILTWETGEAINFDHFEVERSINGKDFITIGKILSSTDQHLYSYTDNSITNKKYYYRLKLVDRNNQINKYSDIRTIEVPCQVGQIKIYPNPTSGIVYLDLPLNSGKVQIQVFNSAGQVISSKVHYTNNQVIIDMRAQANGIYFIKVNSNNKNQQFKILKK